MADAQLRVVVLGHSGEAQQQLRDALDELGAKILATGDFNQLEPEQMREQHPDVWLVSVDENTDAALLEPWQPLFDDPDATVVFDDADVSRRLSGWDLARWARHLAAKVLGRDDVLPPVRADAERLPHSPDSAPDDTRTGTTQVAGTSPQHVELSLLDDADLAAQVAVAAPARTDNHDASLDPPDLSGLSLVDDTDPATPAGDPAPESVAIDSASSESLETGGLSLVDDADFAALSASFDAERNQAGKEQAEAEPAMSLDDLLRTQSEDETRIEGVTLPEQEHDDSAEKTGVAQQPESNALSSLSLMDMDADLPAPRKAVAAKPALDIDIGGLSLQAMDGAEVADAPAAAGHAAEKPAPAIKQADGLIAIIAGLGGPDAVRQFLGALPDALPVPVLLWQHLDAGKHDRLAQQLAKATKLPVYLAKAGDAAQPGAVGVVSTGLVMAKGDGLHFVAGDGDASQGLAPALNDSATVIVVLSGAEAAIVEPARAHSAHGGKVLVQTPMTCFDATAASALDGQGAIVASPAELAGFATARWA